MIYLDSAATTFQKPAAVQRAVVRAMRTMSSPGRGGYAAAQQADELLFRCRSAAAELFSVPSSEQVVFTMNATHGLNIAIKSLVRPCGRVVVSGYEHNAVTRPLHALGAEVIVAAAPLFSPQEMVEAFERAQRPERIRLHSRALIRRAGEGLGKIPNVHGFLSPEAILQAGVLSFTVDGLSPESVAEEMAKRGIALRAGLHCAPFAHKTVGTLPDGTVRLSVSAFNRESEIDTFLSSLRAIAAGQAKN